MEGGYPIDVPSYPIIGKAGIKTLARNSSAHIRFTVPPGLRTIFSTERSMIPDAFTARASARMCEREISLLLHLISECKMPGCPKPTLRECGESEKRKRA